MTRLRSDKLYGFAFPGKESGLFGHFFELHAMAGGRMFEDEGPPAPRLDDEAGHWALGLLKDLYERAAPQRPRAGTTTRSQPASVKAGPP